METAFIGRLKELKLMSHYWQSDKASLVVLYGRRRVGKTRLLTHWLQTEGAYGLYWMAEAIAEKAQLRSFSQELESFLEPDLVMSEDFTYPNWDYAFQKVARVARDRRLVLFLDEVTYLIDVNPDFVGTLQKAWDQWLSKSNILLALCGSQMGLMKKQLLAYDAPLYGRATVQMKLEQLPYGVTSQYFPQYSPADRVMLFGALGGVPAYWERLDLNLTLVENIGLFLIPSNPWIMDESRLLLQDFFSEQLIYASIMRAIANDAHTFSEIEQWTGLSHGHVSRYLSLLRDTGFVERRTPLTQENNPDTRFGRYYVTDAYLRFFYRFLATHQTKLAMGQQQKTMQAIETGLASFVASNTWPELCQEWLLRASDNNELVLDVERTGREWKRSFTIDVVGINEQTKVMVLGACLWNDVSADATSMRELVNRTRSVVPGPEWKVYYMGFSVAGWSEEAEAEIARLIKTGPTRSGYEVLGYRLLTLAEVDADLARWTL